MYGANFGVNGARALAEALPRRRTLRTLESVACHLVPICVCVVRWVLRVCVVHKLIIFGDRGPLAAFLG